MANKKHVLFILSALCTGISLHMLNDRASGNQPKPLVKSVEHTGDVLHIALPVAAVAQCVLAADPVGLYQVSSVMAYSTICTWVPKILFNHERPNGGRNSMPSGHTSLSFAVVFTVILRYGLTMASMTSFICALFVALSRTYSEWHHTMDISVGFLVGLACALYVVKKRPLLR